MKKGFALFFMMLFNLVAYQLFAQSEYQKTRFNTVEEKNFYKISENVKKVLWEERLKATTPSEKKSNENELIKFGRWQYFWKDFVNQDGSLPTQCLDIDLLQLKPNSPLPTLQNESNVLNEKNWKQVGPTKRVNPNGHVTYPGMGRVNVVRKIGPSTYIAGTPQGGIWKTVDNGVNWVPKTDGIAFLSIGDIRMNPNDSMKMYAITGDRNMISSQSIGIIKSTDGGDTWSTTSLVLTTELDKSNSNIGIKPNNPNHMIAVVQNYVYYTTDAWNTYTKGIYMEGGLDVLYTNDFIIISDEKGSIFRSTDNGATFERIYLNAEGQFGGIALRFNPILVGKQDSFYGKDVYFLAGKKNGAILYKASASQILFATQELPLSPVKLGATIPDFNPKDVYCVVLAVNPNNINKIMALGEEGYYSNDGAATWAKKMDVFTTYKSRQTYVHSDHHFAEFIDDTTVLVGHDGGVSLINTKADPFGHTDITGNMIISQIYHSAIYNADKNNENLLLGTQDNGGFSKSPSTKAGEWVAALGSDGTAAGINHRDPLVRFMGGIHGALHRTNTAYLADYKDGNEVIGSDPKNSPFVCEVIIHDQKPNVVFASQNELKFSFDTGKTFYNAPFIWNYFVALDEIDQYADRIAVIQKGKAQKLVKYDTSATIDPFKAFTDLNDIAKPTGITVNFNSVCLASTNNKVIYASVPGLDSTKKVFKSTDNGLTWTNITFDLPNVSVRKILNQVAGIGSFEEIIYVATNLGVYALIRETENSKKWIKVGKMLPNVAVNDLDINYSSLKLYASTFGRGLWELDVNYSVNSTGINDNKITEDHFQVYPNPSSANQSVNIELPQNVNEAKYTLYNYVGGILKSGNLTRSENVISLNGIAPGLYLMSFEVDKIKYCKKIVVE